MSNQVTLSLSFNALPIRADEEDCNISNSGIDNAPNVAQAAFASMSF